MPSFSIVLGGGVSLLVGGIIAAANPAFNYTRLSIFLFSILYLLKSVTHSQLSTLVYIPVKNLYHYFFKVVCLSVMQMREVIFGFKAK